MRLNKLLLLRAIFTWGMPDPLLVGVLWPDTEEGELAGAELALEGGPEKVGRNSLEGSITRNQSMANLF